MWPVTPLALVKQPNYLAYFFCTLILHVLCWILLCP